MEKEYVGVYGYKAIVDESNNTFVIRSAILKENCYLPHIEYVSITKVNRQGRGVLSIFTDSIANLQIVFKRKQLNDMKELYNTLLPYTKRLFFNQDKETLTIYNKGNDDPDEKAFNKINISNPYTYLSFNEINSYEIVCDKRIINNDSLKNTAAGKYVAGGVGALIGALSSLSSGEYITKLQIKLNINDFNNPCVYVKYITRRVKKNSQMAKDLIKMCDEDLAKLEIVVKKNRKTESPKSQSNDPIEEVKKLKELLDMGILTQDEFDKKKKELLNL